MRETHDFRKLEVYKRALVFTKTVRTATKSFPRKEYESLIKETNEIVAMLIGLQRSLSRS
jgi:hypothetical protein